MKKYFKKFSIMFMMTLAIIGIGMIYGGNGANAATVGQQLTSPENGWQRYTYKSNGISYIGTGWTDKNNENYQIYTQNAGDKIEISFYGTEFRYIGTYHNSHNTDVKVSIDGDVSSINQYVNTSIGTTYVLQLEKLNLEKKIHKVEIYTNTSPGPRFVGIDINEGGYLVSSNNSIVLNKSNLILENASTETLIATTTPVSASDNIAWTSSDSSIATVDSSGKVIAISEGSCNITAIIKDGSNISTTCAVTVTKKAEQESISLNKSTTNLTIDDSETLVATTTPAGAQVTWKSSDPSIASVDQNGKVTGVKEGTCTITATTDDGLIATCAVTVTNNTVPVEPQPTESDKIVNIAHAKGDNTNNAGGDVTIIFHGTADTTLSVVKTADVKEVWVGDNFTYTLVITNTGTKTAKAVVVNDPAPNHIDFNVSGVTTTQGTVDSSSTSKNIIVNVGDILPGGTVTIKIPSTVIA
ncbi:Ig-like domain-containing protein [Clostridium saccharoperbutylacetonicum]|uniref:Ig-like domain-containing protein n=1 Tax=Clostridium saccharoperbutylacetonicum TaxID=36745 RepID=UPI0039ED4233